MPPSDKRLIELSTRVTKIADDIVSANTRLTRIETALGVVRWLVSIVVVSAIGSAIGLVVYAGRLAERVAHLEGEQGNSLGAMLKGLQSPDPTTLAANLDLLSAQIAANDANHAVPKKETVAKLAVTLKTVAAIHPSLPETWKAVAALASYSTVQSANPARPDCDIRQAKHVIDQSEVPELPGRFSSPTGPTGYVFRNCTLHMNQLPPGQIAKFTGHIGNGPDEQMFSGDLAVIIDCDIELTDSGVAQSGILDFEAVNCRFEYRVDQVPDAPARQILLASLPTDSSGQFVVSLRS